MKRWVRQEVTVAEELWSGKPFQTGTLCGRTTRLEPGERWRRRVMKARRAHLHTGISRVPPPWSLRGLFEDEQRSGGPAPKGSCSGVILWNVHTRGPSGSREMREFGSSAWYHQAMWDFPLPAGNGSSQPQSRSPCSCSLRWTDGFPTSATSFRKSRGTNTGWLGNKQPHKPANATPV